MCYLPTPTAVQFDPHVACTFVPLFVGGRLVIPRPGGQSSADYIMGLVADHGVSFLPSVPTFGWEHFKNRCLLLVAAAAAFMDPLAHSPSLHGCSCGVPTISMLVLLLGRPPACLTDAAMER
jgi:hypothetical protein